MPPPVLAPSSGSQTWPLADVVSLISSGLRADAAGGTVGPIGMDQRYSGLLAGRGVEPLRSDLGQIGVPIRTPHLEDDIRPVTPIARSSN